MKIFLVKKKWLSAIFCLAIAIAIIAFVNHPAFVGTSATTRQLPIYCVERDDKVVALSFDAAWADVRVR